MLEIRVPIRVQLLGIIRILGIQPVGDFPRIGDPIMVGVFARRACIDCRNSVIRVLHGEKVAGRSAAIFGNNSRIHRVTLRDPVSQAIQAQRIADRRQNARIQFHRRVCHDRELQRRKRATSPPGSGYRSNLFAVLTGDLRGHLPLVAGRIRQVRAHVTG